MGDEEHELDLGREVTGGDSRRMKIYWFITPYKVDKSLRHFHAAWCVVTFSSLR